VGGGSIGSNGVAVNAVNFYPPVNITLNQAITAVFFTITSLLWSTWRVATRWRSEEKFCDYRRVQEIYPFYKASRSSVETVQFPNRWALGISFKRGKAVAA
jgi:hypothetical protein